MSVYGLAEAERPGHAILGTSRRSRPQIYVRFIT